MATLFVYVLCMIVTAALPLNSPILDTYDYIVGGGPGGLTVANRLSEDANVHVLLLEAGPADDSEPYIEMPGLLGLDIGSTYDWNLSTVPQVHLDGRSRNIAQGHGLGGGTLLNGMLWSRGGQGDYDDWVSLGNPGWSWQDLLPYFRKSESFTPLRSIDLRMQYSIAENPGVHGYEGPVNVSFPKYLWNTSAVLFDGLNELGVPTSYDPNDGQLSGASFLPLNLDPDQQTRSTARRAYYDPVASRPNLWVSTNQYVTRIIFENGRTTGDNSNIDGSSRGQGASPGVPGGIYGSTTTIDVTGSGPRKRSVLARIWQRMRPSPFTPRQTTPIPPIRAVGVEFAASSEDPRRVVSANREIVVSAGAFHSPQLLMLSGLGPASHLQDVGVALNVDLPGVGNNLQDHGQVWAFYPYNNDSYATPIDLSRDQQFLVDAWQDYWANRTGPFTTTTIGGVAFPPLPFIVNGSQAIVNAAQTQTSTQYLSAGLAPEVVSGYQQQIPLMIDALSNFTRASYELINGNDGVLTVASMRPFSRGNVLLNSSEPFDPPLIDPRYASNPVDDQVLAAALRFNERLVETDSLAVLRPTQLAPAAGSSDAELLQYIHARLQTEYHPCGTCAMMPRSMGGVVDSNLLVYGTENVRVIDSSIIPMIPAAHLQAVVYAIAEKGSDLMKLANNHPAPEFAPPSAAEAEDSSVTTVTIIETHTVYV